MFSSLAISLGLSLYICICCGYIHIHLCVYVCTYMYACIYVCFWSREDISKQEATKPLWQKFSCFFFFNVHIKGNNLSMDLSYLVRNLPYIYLQTCFFGHLIWWWFHDEYFRTKTLEHLKLLKETTRELFCVLTFKIKIKWNSKYVSIQPLKTLRHWKICLLQCLIYLFIRFRSKKLLSGLYFLALRFCFSCSNSSHVLLRY